MLLGALRVVQSGVRVGRADAGRQAAGRVRATTDLNTLFDSGRPPVNGTMTEDELKYYEDTACPTCGSCSGMFTANP